jgi:hypothetical protein
MRSTSLAWLATLSAVALPGATRSEPTHHVLTNAQVLRVVLRVAAADGERHPSEILLARGPLGRAVKVFDPQAHPTPSGLKALGGANSTVALIAMRGHFTSNGPHPNGRPEPKGRVLELLMNARSGVVFGVSLAPALKVSLLGLGAVTRLR